MCWWEAWLDYSVRERTLLTSTKRGMWGVCTKLWKVDFCYLLLVKKGWEKLTRGRGDLNPNVSMVSVGVGVRWKKHISLFLCKDAWRMAKKQAECQQVGRGGRECQLNVSRGQGSTMSKICVSWNVVVLKEALAISNDSCAWKYALEVWTAMVQFCVSEFGSRELMRTVHGYDHIWT